MNQTEKITAQIQKLPPECQKEVSDFIEFLQLKVENRLPQNTWWSDFSLSSAMAGLENDAPTYELTNLKERWR